MLTFDLIKGLKFGLEYVNLDGDDREALDCDHTMLTILDLGFFRICLFSGQAE